MRRRYLIGLILAIVAVGATAGGITVSAVTGGNGGENASGPEADAAAAAALAMFEGSTLLEVEHGDDPGAVWEVEVRQANGEELEVLLDGNLNQVGVFPNDDANEGPDDDDDGNEGPDDDDANEGPDDDDQPQQ